MPPFASTTKRTRSASATASRACTPIDFVIGDWSAMSTPPVSISRKRLFPHSQTSSLRSRVTPGCSCTTAARVPVRRLTSVDLPTFGNPTIATVPRSGVVSVMPAVVPRAPSADPGTSVFQPPDSAFLVRFDIVSRAIAFNSVAS